MYESNSPKKLKTSKKIIFLFFLICCFLVYQFWLSNVFTEKIYRINLGMNAFWNVYNKTTNMELAQEKIQANLKQDLLNCQTNLVGLQNSDNAKCLPSKICEEFSCTSGKIINVSAFNFPKEIKVHLSENSKAKIGNTIVYQQNLVGRIRDINSRVATISTIFDENEKIPVKNLQNTGFGFVKFESDSQMKLYPLSLNESFKNEDIIVVSPANSQNYLPNLILGKLKIVGDAVIVETVLDFRFIEGVDVVE